MKWKLHLMAVLVLAACLAAACQAACGVPAAAAQAERLPYLDKLPPIIDRDVFFGDPEIASGQISPDGAFISFRKPYRDVMNIWVKGIDEPFGQARPVTADTIRPVRGYGWSWDGRYILYIQDKGGDENFHLYRVDPREKLGPDQDVPEAVDMTPIAGVRTTFYSFPKKTPDYIYIGLNDRDERYHDVYRLQLATGERELVRQNDGGYASWMFDLDGGLRLATRQTEDGGTEIFRIDGDLFTSVYVCSNEENVDPIRFHRDGKRVYMDTNRGEDVDLSRLVLFDPQTLEEELIETDPKKEVDFGGALFSQATDELVGTYYVGDRLRLYWRDKQFEKDYKKLKKELPDGDVYRTSSTVDERIWLVSVTSDTDPGATYIFDRGAGTVEFLYRPRPDLPVEHLAPMEPVRYKARDGLTIHGYLTVPKGIKAKNLPLMVVPHGGPWARDEWGYDPNAQFLANRGYAVFQPNFRSSTGYGKKFFNAGKRQWGDAMQDDITDGVRHLVDKGIADPEMVGIFGGSYGGYATLAGLAFTPELYAVGVSFVGPSSLITLLKSIPPYWETTRKFFNEHIGDPENPEDIERLERQSPLYSAEKITAPLLVVQGANDPRVKKAESDQIVVALRDLGREVEYIVAPDEGHGFAGRENRMAFTVAMEKFLSRHLGGRFQEDVKADIAERLEGISVDVGTVTLAKAEGDLEAARTAPLPKCDAARIRPSFLNYRGAISIGGQEIAFGVERKVEKAAFEGVPVWRVTTAQSLPMVTAFDTFVVDQVTLLPIHRRIEQGDVKISLSYGGKAIRGTMNRFGAVTPVDVALEAPVFGDDAALQVALPALPLGADYRTTLRTFDLQMQQVRVMSLAVTGLETVEVPAGSFEAFKVELKPLDGEMGGGTVFVTESEPRCMVRGTFQLSAQQGGGSVTVELTARE